MCEQQQLHRLYSRGWGHSSRKWEPCADKDWLFIFRTEHIDEDLEEAVRLINRRRPKGVPALVASEKVRMGMGMGGGSLAPMGPVPAGHFRLCGVWIEKV